MVHYLHGLDRHEDAPPSARGEVRKAGGDFKRMNAMACVSNYCSLTNTILRGHGYYESIFVFN